MPVQCVQATVFSGPIWVFSRGIGTHGQSLKREIGLYRTLVSHARLWGRTQVQSPASERSVQTEETKQALPVHWWHSL